MAFRWSEDTTIKFISKYLEHESLWNIKSPQYKNKQIKQRAYADLEKTMDIPGFGEKGIKAKIKSRYEYISTSTSSKIAIAIYFISFFGFAALPVHLAIPY